MFLRPFYSGDATGLPALVDLGATGTPVVVAESLTTVPINPLVVEMLSGLSSFSQVSRGVLSSLQQLPVDCRSRRALARTATVQFFPGPVHLSVLLVRYCVVESRLSSVYFWMFW